MRILVCFFIVIGLALIFYSVGVSGFFEISVVDKPEIFDSAVVIKNTGVNP